MSLQVEKLEKNMAKLTIEVSAEELEKAIEGAYQKNKNKISVPGFRKGKAPRKMLEQMYGKNLFYEDAANDLIPDAYDAALEECTEEIVSAPKIAVVQLEAGQPFIFTAEVALKPEVTLGEYKGVAVDKVDTEVSEEEVTSEIDRERGKNARTVDVTDRAVKEGDIATIDYEGFMDGTPFEGGKGEDYPLVIGSHSFIDDFEDQLIGKKTGDEVEVNVSFPEEYHEASLKGKPALFKVTIKEIKNKELPKLDDEFASEVSEFETLKDYKASVKKSLTEKRKEEVKREKENEVIEKAIENISVEIPEAMIDEQVQQMVQEFASRISSQGISFEQYMQMTGMTPNALMGQMKPEAEKRIKTRLTLEAIVKAEGIKASDKEIEAEMEKMAAMYQMEVDKVKEMMGETEREQIAMDVAVQKAVDLIVKNAVEVEKSEEEKEE